MNGLLFYLFQSGLGLVVFYGVYGVFLSNGTNHRFNRLYLISTAVFSFIFPFSQVNIPLTADNQSSFVVLLDAVTVTSASLQSSLTGHRFTVQMITVIYFAGVLFFALRFFLQLLQLRRLFKKCSVIKYDQSNIVLVDRNHAPFSFFNSIFIPGETINQKISDEIIAHEQIHIRQKHSFDRMLFEIMSIVQWFNPVIWLYKESVKTVHEYLADKGVISGGVDVADYQKLLFGFSFENGVNALTNKFNHSLIKKRIKMMTQIKSNLRLRLKFMIAVPVTLLLASILIVLPMLQSCTQNVRSDKAEKQTTEKQQQANNENETQAAQINPQQAADEQIYNVVEVMPKFPGGQGGTLKYLKEAIVYPEKARKAKKEGKVFISFVVEKDGSISNVELLRGFDPECDEAALKAIREMPKWEPGLKDGRPVRTKFNIPVKFKLN